MRLVNHRCLLALLLAYAMTSVAAHDGGSRSVTGEALRRGDGTAPRRMQRPRLYPGNAGYIRQLPTGARPRARIPYRAPPSRDLSGNEDCAAGVRRTLLCVKVTDDRDGDPFVEALLEIPSNKTILLLDKLGIPAIKDVPPIVIINPGRGVFPRNVFGLR
jgi:hypothetical protein